MCSQYSKNMYVELTNQTAWIDRIYFYYLFGYFFGCYVLQVTDGQN